MTQPDRSWLTPSHTTGSHASISFSELIACGANAMLFFDIMRFTELEQRYGESTTRAVISRLDRALESFVREDPSILHAARSFGDDYFIFLRLDADTPDAVVPLALERARALERRLIADVEAAFPSLTGAIAFHLSAVPLFPAEGESLERLFYRVMKLAFKLAKRTPETGDLIEREALFEIIAKRNISAVYQPIVSLADGAIIGYEALSRGPKESALHSPLKLFHRAERENMLYIVEKIARERAIEGAAFLSIEQKLFLNVSPAVIHDVTFTSGNTRKMLAARGIDPEQVVFEVTEQQAINDFTLFREVIEHYRRQGFLIAVDDAGAGYASFQTILALKPDYIKLDRSLVAGIDFDPVKQSLLESFVFFAYKVNSRLIAEGVETLGELTQLIRLGVYAAQGYYLARPAHPPATDIPKEAVEHIFRHRRLIAFQKQQQDTIEIIVAPVHTFDHRTITAIVRQYFDETRDGGVVITQGGRVAGLVMREKLMQVLASQYGHSLYSRRPVSLVADPEPLIVDRATPIDVVARLAMARPADKAYDYIIVTDGERLLGTVSIEAILNYLANVKMEAVRLSNPLTGLPGNHAIDLAVRDRIEADRPFALLYVDLDRFKRYNDRFGYQRGDQIILYLAETLKSSTLSFPDVETFIGHIGGDDFILITRPEIAAPLAEEILAAFERGIGFYYQEANATEPSADAEARVTVSIAVVVCERPRGLTTEVLSERAAQVKKRVKQLAGSAYVIERM